MMIKNGKVYKSYKQRAEAAEARAERLAESNRELSESVTTLRAEVAQLQAAISAAVQAERSRCAEIALDCFFDLTDTSTMSAPDVIKRTRYGIAAAIRARHGRK